MGYIPAEPLPPEDGLKLLRTFNTTIAIRLNVHERLPRQMKKWKVANGRVTFTVDHEFEMDLFTLSEDETEPWQFIDLRFLFSPAPEIDAEGRFLMQFKAQADHMLRKSGLSGCFDFIHSFVLTHKISTLGTQAYQLSRGVWGGTLNVEPVHRSLIVQYWVERPGKKNWVEIGISTNKPKSGKISWRGPPISSLAARWFRDGKEVKGVDLKFDFNDLSMERILRRTISLHISSILKATQDAISPRLKIHPSLSETEPSECSLEVTLGRSNNKTILSVEQVSGRYVLQPSTWVSTQAERAINQFTATSPSTAITQLLTQTLHDSIKRCAELLGWRTLPRNTLRMDALKQATKLDVLHYVLLRPTGWTAKWILAAVIDASGESWWALELGGQGTVVEHAEHISMERTGPIPEISRDTLASIDRVAVQQLEYHVSMRELRKRGVQCSVCTDLAATESPDLSTDSASLISSTALRGWSLNVRTSDLLQSKTAEDQWLDPYIRVISQGFASDYRDVSHIASGTMVKSVAADMQKLMSASVQSNFAFSEDGKFAIHLTTPFGEPIADELKARLRDVDRLRSFATILQKRKMKLRKSSLQQVQFQYGETDTATVDFGREDDIKVTFPPKNPHNRIARFLTELINNRPPFNTPENSGLDRFCETLVLTRPILAALAELENATPGNLHDPAVFVHHVNYYRITYANPLCSFDIQLRQKDDKMLWHIDDNNKKDNELKPGPERNPNHKRIETLKTALSILFKKTGGPDQKWIGVRSGILAPLDGIPDALKALHETVTSCAVEGGYKMPTDIKAEEASTTPATKGSRVAVPAPAPVAPVPAPSPASTGISASTHAQNQATQQRRNFPNLGRKPQGKGPKQEVIELD
jgi:mediator of RNA polymerase II transcription subunit 14